MNRINWANLIPYRDVSGFTRRTSESSDDLGTGHGCLDVGIPQHYAEKLKILAQQYKTVLIFRPFGPDASFLLDLNKPCKGIGMPKSANWGFQLGRIPTKQEFSKLEDPGKIVENQARVRTALKNGKQKIHLALSDDEFRHRISTNQDTIRQVGTRQGFLRFEVRAPSGKKHFFLIKKENGLNLVYHHNKEAFYVLAENGEELIADMDLLAICPRWIETDFNDKDRPRLSESPNVTVGRIQKTLSRRGSSASVEHICKGLSKRSTSSSSLSPPSSTSSSRLSPPSSTSSDLEKEWRSNLMHTLSSLENPKTGNVTPRIEEWITRINETLRPNGLPPVVLHNADSGNPDSVEKENYPATSFLPDGRVVIIKNSEEFIDHVKELNGLGYYVPLNDNWVGIKRALSDYRKKPFE